MMKYLSFKYWKLLFYIKSLKWLQDNIQYKKRGIVDHEYFENHWSLHSHEIIAYYNALDRLKAL